MTRKNLITEHYHNKSAALFHATTKLKNADIAIHSIDFDAKRINIEKPTTDQALQLGWKAIFSTVCGSQEIELNGFKINWKATKKIIEIKGTGAIA